MINSIIQNEDLFSIVRTACEENGIGADIDQSLLSDDGFPLDGKLIILKIDEYYNSQNIADRPKSIDFLVLVKCCDEVSYSLYLIELKNTADKSQLRPTGIIAKFATTVDDFINKKFKEIFEDGIYKNIKLYLVSQKNSNPGSDRKNRSSQFDAFSTVKPFELLGRRVSIEPKLPNPKIEPC